MAKLKFDRNLNLALTKEETITVPNDEFWKGMFIPDNSSSGAYCINELKNSGGAPFNFSLGGVPAYWTSCNYWGCV